MVLIIHGASRLAIPVEKIMIENETAYQAAIARNIRMNAKKGRRKVWMKLEGAERVNEFLNQFGEFEPSYDESGRYQTFHPVVKVSIESEFFHAMRQNEMEYGGLTEKQNAAVLAMIARGEEKVAQYAAKRAEEAATSNWISTVGKREEFTLNVRHVISMSGLYGMSYIHIMNDDAGNVVIYKGTNCLGDKGARVTVKATVKEHGERDGVKQTIISRPKGV